MKTGAVTPRRAQKAIYKTLNGRVVPTGAAPEKFAVSHRAGFSKVYEGDKL